MWRVATPSSYCLLYLKPKSNFSHILRKSLIANKAYTIRYAIQTKFNTSNGSHRNNEQDYGGKKIKMQGAFCTFDDAKQKITYKLLP